MKIRSSAVSILQKPNSINLLYVPAVILFICLIVYPFFEGLRIAFTDWNGFSQHYDYVGLENFKYLFKDKSLFIAIVNTLLYGIGSTFFQQIFGLSYALLLNKKIFGRNFARTLIYLPVLIAPVIMGYMWYFIFQYSHGALNDILSIFGAESVDWLAKGDRAIILIIFANTIQFCGISMVIYLAGLQTIPKMYYEASGIDGASVFCQFRYITVPMLRPAFITSITLNLIGGLKLFDVIKALTNGGPGYASHSLSTLIDYTYFKSQSAGYSAAMGILLFILIMVVTLAFNKLSGEKELG
ncbi:MAG: sugar ABC transporter permease [Spirochaetales bacterium]|nr:sugar ABC transporter permease [Spirochaetales bacterium]